MAEGLESPATDAFSSSKPPTSTIATMLASATAGTLARLPIHPIDTVKAKLQVMGWASSQKNTNMNISERPRALKVFGDILRREGIRGLYQGLGVTLLGSAPASCLYFTTYEATKKALLHFEPLKENQFAGHFLAGFAAETASCVLWVPIDVLKERMQVQTTIKTYTYRSTIEGVRIILRDEGLRGFYRGYGATLLSFGPFSALYFLFYEQAKRQGESFYNDYLASLSSTSLSSTSSSSSVWIYFCSSTYAGCLASFLTNPLDMAKLRLQVQRASPPSSSPSTLPPTTATTPSSSSSSSSSSVRYKHIADALKQIVVKEGIWALWRGAATRMAFHVPSTAITMTLYESLQLYYGKWV